MSGPYGKEFQHLYRGTNGEKPHVPPDAPDQWELRAMGFDDATRPWPPVDDSEHRTQADPFKIEFITSAELDAGEFTIDFHIDDAIPVREPGVIGAPSKALKTTMAATGFMSMASGDNFLGRFPVQRPIRCGLISAESGFAALQRTARAIAKAAGRELKDYRNLLWSKQILDLGSRSQINELKARINGEGLEAICLDPAYLMMPGIGDSANNLFEVGKYLIELTHIVADCNCTPVINHHFKKSIGDPYQEPELEWLAHAGFINWARWWWLMNRRSKYDPQNRGCHQLWLHFGGSSGHSSAWAIDVDEGLQSGHGWTVDVQFASDAREEKAAADASIKGKKKDMEAIQESTKARTKVENALQTLPKGGTLTEVAAIAKVSSNIARGILHDLALRKVVRECGIVKRNRDKPYDGFILMQFQEHPDNPTVGVQSECSRDGTTNQPDTPT